MDKTQAMGLSALGKSNELNVQEITESLRKVDDEMIQRGFNIRWFGADPTGAQSSVKAVTDAQNGTTDTIYVPKGVYLIDQDFIFLSSKRYVFDRDSRFKIANGKTLTVNSAISAYESDWIFDITLGGTITGTPQVREIYPQWFGAKGNWNGTTGADDTSAIQAALDLANSMKAFVHFPVGIYQISRTLYLGANVYISGYISGFSTNGSWDTISFASLIFTNSDPNSYLFTGKNGITGGQMIVRNIGIFTGLSYNTGNKKNILLYKYDCQRHSLFEGVQIGLFDYVFYQGSFSMASRIQYCEIRNIGRAIFNGGNIVDAYFYNNYFHGHGTTYTDTSGKEQTVSCDFIQNPSTLAMCQFLNNWFEFFDYGFKVNSMEQCTFVGNIFDYIYRAFDKVGIACTLSGNVFNHCNKESMVNHNWWKSTNGLTDNDWRTIIVGGHSGISIVGNVAGAVDTFIDIIGGNGAIKDMYSSGNMIRTDNTLSAIDPNRIIRVSVGITSWLQEGHMTNMKLEELNDTFHSVPPQTGLFPGRRVIVNGKSLTMNTSFKWVDKDGNQYGYNTKNLIPKFNDPAWNITDHRWVIVDTNGYKLKVNGYTTSGWPEIILTIPTAEGKKYRFNTKTSYFASDNSHRNIIEIYLCRDNNRVITYYYNQNNGSYEFSIPNGINKIQIALRCNTTTESSLTFFFDTLFLSEYSNLNYGTILISEKGDKFLKYIDALTNTEITEPYV
ncbi:hypothetical protein [Paenibacillus protaetiae]|uniref:Pectate lyase superfamily protein domain-containing protein n=1 Tax=Paenibacillus protaetiae TaxID=2509456 RepID=A0A4P6F161_9BACL|nr:hypothetical protein [Paenibacillus protaetiae]QAY66757.1 hypothetical protein ET464_10395 [Paenibacillus protaetiae]